MNDFQYLQPQLFEAFIKASQYMVRLKTQQDMREHLSKLVMTYFPAGWTAFAKRDAKGLVTIYDFSLSGASTAQHLSDSVKQTVADVLDSGFLATQVIDVPTPSMTVFLPIVEEYQTGGVMLIGHRTASPIAADLLNVYLAIAGLAGETSERLHNELELNRHRTQLEKLVKERTAELSLVKHQNELILNSVGEGICGLDPDGRINFVNPAAAKMIGWNPEHLIGLDGHDAFHYSKGVDCACSTDDCPVRLALKNGNAKTVDDEDFFRKDGTRFPVEFSVSPIKEGSRELGSVLVFRDISERKFAEAAIKRSNQKINEILDSIQEDFYVVDSNWNFVFASRTFTSKIGKMPVDFVGKNLWQMFPKHIGTDYELNLRVVMDQKEMRRFEIGGKYTNAYYEMVVFPSQEGIIVLGSDITNRKKTEDALKDSQKQLLDIIDGATNSIVVKDLQGKFIIINAQLEKLFGQNREEVKGKTDYDIISREKADNYRDTDRRIAQNDKPEQVQEEADLPDGKHHYFLANKFPLHDIHGKTYAVASISTDITEIRMAEKAVKESEEKFSKAFHSSPIGLVITHLPDGRWVDANDTYLKMLEYTREEVMGHTSGDLNLYPDADKRTEIFQTLRDHGKISNIELRLRTKSGRILQTLSSVETVELEGQQYALSTNIDITARKEAEEELRRRTAELEIANQELEAFSYSVSHDLRAPLRSMAGFSNILIEDYDNKLDADGKLYLKKIQKSSEFMAQLIDDLLKLARVARSDINYNKLNLSEMAAHAISELQAANPSAKVKVTIQKGLTDYGDPILLRRVIDNLVGNAWKFSSKTVEPSIEIGTMKYKGKQAYFVRDNGTGFDMTYADKLFKPFQRLHPSSEFSGTGIGLAIVRRIIRRHGGEVWAEGKIGEGATFYFTLN